MFYTRFYSTKPVKTLKDLLNAMYTVSYIEGWADPEEGDRYIVFFYVKDKAGKWWKDWNNFVIRGGELVRVPRINECDMEMEIVDWEFYDYKHTPHVRQTLPSDWVW